MLDVCFFFYIFTYLDTYQQIVFYGGFAFFPHIIYKTYICLVYYTILCINKQMHCWMMYLSYGNVHFKIKVCLHISSRLKTQWSSSTEPHGLRSQWIFFGHRCTCPRCLLWTDTAVRGRTRVYFAFPYPHSLSSWWYQIRRQFKRSFSQLCYNSKWMN